MSRSNIATAAGTCRTKCRTCSSLCLMTSSARLRSVMSWPTAWNSTTRRRSSKNPRAVHSIQRASPPAPATSCSIDATGFSGVMAARNASEIGRCVRRQELPELLADQLLGRALEVATIRGVDERVSAVGQKAADEIGLIFDHRAVLLLAATQARRRLRVLPYQRRQQHQRDGDEEEESLQRDDDLGDRAGGEWAPTGSRARTAPPARRPAGASPARRGRSEPPTTAGTATARGPATDEAGGPASRRKAAAAPRSNTRSATRARRPAAACAGSPPTHWPRRKGSAPRR